MDRSIFFNHFLWNIKCSTFGIVLNTFLDSFCEASSAYAALRFPPPDISLLFLSASLFPHARPITYEKRNLHDKTGCGTLRCPPQYHQVPEVCEKQPSGLGKTPPFHVHKMSQFKPTTRKKPARVPLELIPNYQAPERTKFSSKLAGEIQVAVAPCLRLFQQRGRCRVAEHREIPRRGDVRRDHSAINLNPISKSALMIWVWTYILRGAR